MARPKPAGTGAAGRGSAKAARRRRIAEAGQRQPFVNDYLLYLLGRASFQASAQFHAIVKSHGLAVIEWRVLGALWGGPETIGALAEMALHQQPTVTKVVDRMAAAGLVRRQEDGADRRRVRVALTEKGQALAAILVPLAKAHEARVLAGYAPREAAALKRTLRTLIARTDGDAADNDEG